jgi:hypothetical protein
MSWDFLKDLPAWAQGLITVQTVAIVALWRERVKDNREKTELMQKLIGLIGLAQKQNRSGSDQE